MLRATISPVSEARALEREWRALEQKTKCHFFLRWCWARAIIDLYGSDATLARVSYGGETVALGLFTPVRSMRHRGVLRVRQLRLGEAGEGRDRAQPEYSTLLCAPAWETPAWSAVLSAFLTDDAPAWDELVVSNANPRLEEAMRASASPLGLHVHRFAQAGSAAVDLAALRAHGATSADEYAAGLEGNGRRQLTRALSLYHARGGLRLERAETVDEAQCYLDRLAAWHEAKWRARGLPGLQSLSSLLRFHRALIECAFDEGRIELACITANGEAIAYIYNFIDDGAVFFHMGGFKAEADNRLKPGLVAHALLIAIHARAGRMTYDFLAGDDRYKRQLGAPGQQFVSFAVQRPTFALRVERFLRGVRNSVLNLRQ